MTDRIEKLLSDLRAKKHHQFRRSVTFSCAEDREGEERIDRVADALCAFLREEEPVLLQETRIAFLRTICKTPEVLTEKEKEADRESHYIHEMGRVCNISPNYSRLIGMGLDAAKEECIAARNGATEAEQMFLNAIIREIDAVIELAERYRKKAVEQGNAIVAQTLATVPRKPAQSFLEALQFFRILHFTLWAEGEYHNTVGRFDQYMLPYLLHDLNAKELDEEGALELLEEFFISFNYDSDLYPGVQQGDNGQSMMLGGMTADGQDGFNILSEMCLKASMELCLIDPKINLRVSRTTPLSRYELGTRLTEKGLGFPQYSNDDIVIPGLMRLGYDEKDARNYTVAACWEFIIPNVGMDIPNIGAVNFPKLTDECIRNELSSCSSFEALMEKMSGYINRECEAILASIKDLYILPAPFMSLMMDGCVERRRDISEGSKYNNYGLHGVGLSAAVDSLSAVKTRVFERHDLTPERLVSALESDFENEEELLHCLRYETPKLGNNDPGVNEILDRMLNQFADALDGKRNERGGCVRAGTGSAMFYLWHAEKVGFLANGHIRGEGFGANYAPELFVRNTGPVSAVCSMARPALVRTVNGGPMTMEIHSAVFQNPECITKVAEVVKYYIDLGGHQLQINAVNADVLRDAQAHPENYPNLIVRIWGWSAYFVELDKEYQDHVIARQEFGK